MAFNLRPFGKIINVFMYSDTCTISRVKETTNEYGASGPSERVVIYKDIKCKFSFVEKDSPTDSNGTYMPVLKQVTVFADLDYNIIAGDYIEGYRIDPVTGIKQKVNGICGEPNRFDTHQEISIQIEGAN
jgi:hypothetical protein